ncbi:class I adenylate-forming enzyme family protein [Saccharomonospora saliphila]|uniref:class I adenylate-forming enzyme family protein n=1 Tax=Saccharomonospora saliphila TaxID=369829 RepID=UPI000662586B|nr:AMP-binding protein [Saccharomonospora saliphila]
MPTTSAPRPPGLPPSLTYPEVGVGSLLAGAATRYGDRVAFHHRDRALSFTELWHSACRFGHALHAHGIGRGDTVALHLPNCLAFPVAYYGTLLAGATFSPANPLLPREALHAQLDDCAAKAVVTHGRLAEALSGYPLEAVIAVEPADTTTTDFAAFGAHAPATRPDVALDVETDLAHLGYTGGTTGRSKGVRLTHRNVVANALQYVCWGSGAVPALDEHGDVTVERIGAAGEWDTELGTGATINLTPWFHAMGLGGLNIGVVSGTSVTIHDRFDPRAYVADAERLRVTSMSGAPALFGALLACEEFHTADLSSVRGISSGAAPMPHEMIRALLDRFPEAVLTEGYGLTEVTMGATLGPSWRSGTRKVGTVGVPIFDTEVRIVPVEGGEELPPNTPGEVCVRGPQVMRGYHNRPEETAAVLVDGWLRTGDIGVLDEDGYLSVVDRAKDLLLYKGYNVYPRELEELLTDLPEVASAAVVGRPSAEAGELPVAFVVRAPGYDVSADSLMEAVNARVVPYKRLREVHFVDAIPVSAAGKILKRELRDRLPAPPPTSPSPSPSP